MRIKLQNVYQRNYIIIGLAATFVLAFVLALCIRGAQQVNITTQNKTFFSTCTEAKKSGATPLTRGKPGYRLGLDKDRDGLACE